MALRLRTLLAVGVIVIAQGAAGAPCAGFSDVDDSSGFCINVQWMKNRGITLGCTATLYCPNDYVTRLQMAAFIYRLGVQNAFLHQGSRFGEPAVLGTTDGQPMEIIASGDRVMRYEPNLLSPNVIGGSPMNAAAAGLRGVVIAGGGTTPGAELAFNNEGPNLAHDVYATVGGGFNNIAGSANADVIDGALATIGGGMLNRAAGLLSTVGGGIANQAEAQGATIAGGQSNVASAQYATVAGGLGNVAAGSYSFAAGRNANAGSGGCFVWSDNSHSTDETQCGVANAFVARAKGGFYMITGGTQTIGYTGAYLAPGATSWTTFSDRNGKENFASVDAMTILERVAALPIATWNWTAQDASIRHIGPMAQDFHAAFGLGESPLGINTVDADGVALAAIQGLHAKLQAQADEIRDLRAQMQALRSMIEQAGDRAGRER